jgi:uncharacterized protein RhaS with RHS repeats
MAVQTEELRGHTITLDYDECPENPRQWGTSTVLLAAHRRYDLSDKPCRDADDIKAKMFEDILDQEDNAILRSVVLSMVKSKPVRRDYKYEKYDRDYYEFINDHWDDMDSEDQLALDRVLEARAEIQEVYMYDHSGIALSTNEFGCRWDSGQIGYIYMKSADIISEFGADTPETRAQARKRMDSEIDTFSRYINGEVYCYCITDADDKVVGSCSGYYDLDFALSEARRNVPETESVPVVERQRRWIAKAVEARPELKDDEALEFLR